jgi:hypothetical protein
MILHSVLLSSAAAGTLEEWTTSASLVLDGTVTHVRYLYDEKDQMPTTVWGIQLHESLKGSVRTGWIEMSSVGQGMLPDRMHGDAPAHGLHLYPGERVLLFAKPASHSGQIELIGGVGPLLVAGPGPDGVLRAHKSDSGARKPLGPCGIGQGLTGTPLLGSLDGLHWEERARAERALTDWPRVCPWSTLLQTLRVAAGQAGQAAATIEGAAALPAGEHLLDGTVRAIPSPEGK